MNSKLYRYGLLVPLVMAFVAVSWVGLKITPFPMHSDGCWYDMVARNVAAGRGLVEDCVWNFAISFKNVTHPITNYWNPLSSLIVAEFYRLFGVSNAVGRLPAFFLDFLVALGVYFFTSHRTGSPRMGALAFLIYSVHIVPWTFRTGGGMPEAFLLFFLTFCCYSLIWAWEGRAWAYLAAAAFGAGAYLSRNEGGLSIGVITLVFFYREIYQGRWAGWRRPGRAWALLGATLLVFGAIVAPWEIRNRLLYGSLANLPKYRFFFAKSYWDIWSYSADSTLSSYLAMGLGPLLAVKLASYGYKFQNFIAITGWPLLLFLVPGILAARWQAWVRPITFYLVLSYLVMGFLNSVSQQAGWNGQYAFLPFLIPVVVMGIELVSVEFSSSMQGRARLSLALGSLVLLALVAQDVQQYRHQAAPLNGLEATMETVGDAVRRHSKNASKPVMSYFDFALTYYTGIPTVKTPTHDAPETIAMVAQHYGCSLLVLVGDTSPSLHALYTHEVSYPWAKLVETIPYPVQLENGGNEIQIYRLRPPA